MVNFITLYYFVEYMYHSEKQDGLTRHSETFYILKQIILNTNKHTSNAEAEVWNLTQRLY